MDQIPSGFYAVLGALIVTNISAVGALIIFIFKAGAFVSETKMGIAHAHERIDKIEAHVIL